MSTKIFTVDGCDYEFTSIQYRCTSNDGALTDDLLDGLFIRCMSDEFGNGDGIVGNCCSMPDDDEEARSIIESETANTCFAMDDETGIYYMDLNSQDAIDEYIGRI